MSPNHYPVFAVSQYDKPEQIKLKIKMLIQLYAQQPNTIIAQSVAKNVTAILAHHKYINDKEQRCQLRKLEMHWRRLAWISSPSAIT